MIGYSATFMRMRGDGTSLRERATGEILAFVMGSSERPYAVILLDPPFRGPLTSVSIYEIEEMKPIIRPGSL